MAKRAVYKHLERGRGIQRVRLDTVERWKRVSETREAIRALRRAFARECVKCGAHHLSKHSARRCNPPGPRLNARRKRRGRVVRQRTADRIDALFEIYA